MENTTKTETPKKSGTKTFRAKPETIEQLESIVGVYGNHETALRHLIELHEFEEVRRVLPGSVDIIDAFEKNVDGIKNAFLYALELKTTAEENAKELVQKQLATKDQTIADLQCRINESKSEVARLNADLQAQLEQQTHLLERVELAEKTAQKLEEALIDKEKLLVLQEKQLERQAGAQEYTAKLENEVKSLRSAVEMAKHQEEVMAREKAALTEELKKMQNDHKRDLAFSAKEAESECRAAVLAVREELQTKIDTYVSKIEAKDAEIARMNAEIVELKITNTKKEAKKCQTKEKTSNK